MQVTALTASAPEVPINLNRAIEFEPTCEQCFRRVPITKDDQYPDLSRCERCEVTFFCSEVCRSASLGKHQQQHCSVLQEITACESTEDQARKNSGELGVLMPTASPRTTYVPRQSLRSWKEYFVFSGSPHVTAINDRFQPTRSDQAIVEIAHLLK